MHQHTLLLAVIGALIASSVHAQSPAVSDCPDDFEAYASRGQSLTCACSAQAVARGSVAGIDVYRSSSSVCRAALHAGVLSPQGGTVTVIPEAGRPFYPGLTRNGFTSYDTERSHPSSFRFGGARDGGSGPAAVSQCPDDFDVFGGTREPHTCLCSTEATARGRGVWGIDVYRGNSGVCRAALHAGAVSGNGGPVTVIPEAGRDLYLGVTRNGLSSYNSDAPYKHSFRFAPAGQTAAAPPRISDCPDDLDAYSGPGESLTCTCSVAQAAARGSVVGIDVYRGSSSVCRAAVHAGVISSERGGTVKVIPEAGRAFYPGVTRNGITSMDVNRPYKNSFRFDAEAQVAAAPQATPPAAATAGIRPAASPQIVAVPPIGPSVSPPLPSAAPPAAAPPRTQLAERRVALVIGNGAYRHAGALANPRNDAADTAAALKRVGFETIVGLDVDRAGMEDAVIRFARAAREADVAMFYFAGHAMQHGGVNYLMPVDAKLRDEADLRRIIRVDEIVADLQQAKNLRILILDACRDNPLAEEFKRSVGSTRGAPVQRGLAKIDSPRGMIVAYATQAGRTAEDGRDRNSPFTSALLKHIETPEEIGTVFRRITSDVYSTTKQAQLPELSLSLIGEFYLRGRPPAQAGAR
jgi:surface antigen